MIKYVLALILLLNVTNNHVFADCVTGYVCSIRPINENNTNSVKVQQENNTKQEKIKQQQNINREKIEKEMINNEIQTPKEHK